VQSPSYDSYYFRDKQNCRSSYQINYISFSKIATKASLPWSNVCYTITVTQPVTLLFQHFQPPNWCYLIHFFKLILFGFSWLFWLGLWLLCLNQFYGCPTPPRAFVGYLSFWQKPLQMPHYGVQIMQQNPHPSGLTSTQMPHPWGTKYKFSEDFWSKKSNGSSITYQYISVFKIDSVAISFQNVFN
jgi:hypothetical protein